jgi:hypothetical protein
MADLDALADEAIRQLNAFKEHLSDGDRSRRTMVHVARQDWSGKYRDEFESGLHAITGQSASLQTEIDGLISKIKRELEAAKKQKGGH